MNRSEELAALTRHAEVLTSGQGCTVVVRGAAGQGASALLHHWLADRTDGQVLEVRGIESEIDLPFAGLATLLTPVLGLVDDLEDPQRAALRAALALGPVTGHDRFTVFVAVVSLLARAARNGPLVVAVDDAHHLDPSTLDALAFASRRLGDDAVMMVLVGRTEALTPFAHATPIDLPPLTPDDARAVLQQATGSALHPAVSQRLVEAAGGNPSVLIALVAMLNPDQLRGRLPLGDPLPVGPRFEVEVARQLAGLPPETRRALLVVAVGAADQPVEVDRALASEGGGTDPLVPAERIGFVDVDVDGRYRLRDSLVRAAIYHGSAAPDRRAAHQALADVVAPGSMRRAVHRDAGCVGTDEAIATALEVTAIDAGGRGETASSWHLWERAARRSPGTADRNRRLLGAAEAALRVGSPDAAQRVLADVEPHLGDQDRDRWDLLRARLLVVTGRPEAAAEVLNDRAAHLTRDDPVQAGALLLEAVPALLRNGRIGTALMLARRAADLVEPCGGVVEARSAVALGAALAAAGDTEASRPLLERHQDVVAHEGWAAAAPFLADTIALAHIRSGDFERASTILDHLAHAIGEASAPHSAPGVLAMQGFLDYRTGRLAEAVAESSQAVQFADETGQPGLLAFPLGTLATVEAMRGDEVSCRSAARRLLELGDNQEGGRGHNTIARSALGLLELGLGRPDRAVVELEPLTLVRSRPSVLMWEVDLADALIRTGRIDDARPVIAALEAAAAVNDDERADAAVVRLRALIAPPDEREAALGQAVTRARSLGLPFGLARSLLDHGGWLRRQRRRKAARASLQEALTRFEAMGATSWATLAAAELGLCTGAARPVAVEVDSLTPQERQVASLVASGCSNREVSARLFVSVRTVESHLSRIYRKLGLRSRSELARSIDER